VCLHQKHDVLNEAVLNNDVLKTEVLNEAVLLPLMYRVCPYKKRDLLNECEQLMC
jgi:hypothetical protein